MGDRALTGVLEESQRLGFLGERPIPDVIEHSRTFVDALAGVTGVVADLGSGGGVPGLVIANDRPDLDLVLIDRRAKRTDFLGRMITRLSWTSRVSVVNADVDDVIRAGRRFDASVARGFGPPDLTLTVSARLVREGGRLVISEPPTGDRWPAELVAELGLHRVEDDKRTVAVFESAPLDGFT